MADKPLFELKRHADGTCTVTKGGNTEGPLTLDQAIRALKDFLPDRSTSFTRQYHIELRQTATAEEFDGIKEEVVAAARSLLKEGRQVIAFSDDFFQGNKEIKETTAITKK